MGHDASGWVTRSNGARYSYDQISNRLTRQKEDTSKTIYAANALNQYFLVGTIVPVYDVDGNLLTGLSSTVEHYDHMGRLIHKGDTVNLYDGYNAIAE